MTAITDNTIVVTWWADHRGNPPPCTWADFKSANADDHDAVDFAEIAATIATPGGVWRGGGGASPQWFLRAGETLDVLTSEFQGEVEKRGLPLLSADELLTEIIGEPGTKEADVDYVLTFIARWEGGIMIEREEMTR